MDFDFKQGFRRLLARCPSLVDQRISTILSLERGGDEHNALRVVQDLLIKPNSTVTVASCFRPILSDVISGLVQSMQGSTFNLTTHEYVCMAFSRVLELAPYLLSSILQYFTFAPSPFERLFRETIIDCGPSLLEVIRASYRFLQLEPRSFRELWDWSPFLNILQWTGGDNASDVRWCAVQILSLVFRMSDAASRDLSCSISKLSEEESFACLIRWEEFSHEIALEKAGMYTDSGSGWSRLGDSSGSSSAVHTQSVIKWKQEEGGGLSHVLVCGVELRLRPDFERSKWRSRSSFVVTPAVKSQMEAVALALNQRQPILLEGPLGSGKSSLIREFARLTGNSDVLFIHLDDQMDIKVLLGNYVCTEIPGEFKWQPGTLAQAVRRGLWVVFEDIDKGPSELFSSLVSLLEDRTLQIPGRGETIYAAENFRLFATITRMKFGSVWKSSEGRDGFSYLWRKIVIDAPSEEELSLVVKERFPGLCNLSQKLIGIFNLVKDISSQSSACINSSGRISIHIGRHFSIRDLIKFCKRVSGLVVEAIDISNLTDTLRDQIYLEAVDCFVASISNSADRQLVMRVIAEQLGIPLERSEYYTCLFKPISQELPSALQIGRVVIPSPSVKAKGSYKSVFADTGHTMRMLERIARCVEQQEPILLVGETGTGKTTLVQRLAWQMSIPLTVVNLSQQSDVADLLGGFRPVEAQSVCLPLFETFNQLFAATFSLQKNEKFWAAIQQYAEKKKWLQLMKAFRAAVAKLGKLLAPPGNEITEGSSAKASKRQKMVSQDLLEKWRTFSIELNKTEKQVEASKSAFAFAFIEGALVKALRTGSWLLLDEINLAPVEILERLNGVFDGAGGSICLTERGDLEIVERHPNFRIFACMNPATDVGKRELPVLLRNRLTEVYVDEMGSREDLETLVFKYLEGAMPSPPVEDIVNFFLKAREEAEKRLLDGAGHKPQYSLRSLSRALEYTRHALATYGFQRALYDGVCMSFLTLLDQSSATIMEHLVEKILFKQPDKSAAFKKSLLRAPAQPTPDHVLFEQFWIQRGNEKQSEADAEFCSRYVLTRSIRDQLKNLARAVFIRKYPVLLQGPTSSGKTSLVRYLASMTGHRFVRINNHEHTDLQEYLGCYISDHTGKLVFQEGLLVEAVRKGYWVVLDELNLAPSDVLEALNRLLDDNRELFVPELQVSVKPHPHFMLFATQNPPGIYGGRKALSRAFRNRFIELHVDDIPAEELITILEKRCDVPASYAGKMVEVMKELQRHRQGSKIFAGKHGYITPRDLFRWAERHRKSGISYDDLAWSGYVLLAERIRDVKEKAVVQTALEKNLRVTLNPERIQELSGTSALQRRLQDSKLTEAFGRIVWTKSMRRLFYLAEQCYEHNEPLLLVGETGCGKTTVCQLLALSLSQKLHILNCHQHTETSDFLGGFRPIRGRENIATQYQDAVLKLNSMRFISDALSSKMENAEATIDMMRHVLKQNVGISGEDVVMIKSMLGKLESLQQEWQSLFVWQDGPLVNAMRNGDVFLVDEISLADDSVLERLNSVLEPKGSLVLAEKGGFHVEEIFPHPRFRLVATMNPGGDFGKKELSPALKNRFTEVWVPPISDLNDLRSIISERLNIDSLVEPLIQFWQWFQQWQETSRYLSVRDLLSWINFINYAASEIGSYTAFVHGAFLVLLDGIGMGSGLSSAITDGLKAKCVQFLLNMVPEEFKAEAGNACSLECTSSMEVDSAPRDHFGIHPFYIPRGSDSIQGTKFEFRAPTTSRNVMRILRAMQLQKPILLEGSPGVGKTSLVSALAAASGHMVVRINLSEQTDILDLFGSDLPVEGGKPGEFQWSDGVFLQALKAGKWVLLDELNLASQSVLEGLNACLDHRGEVFIPELGLVFKCPPTFRLFACQNPLHEGGGRKGLPKSFLNRFTRVYAEPLSSSDYFFIARALHPSLPEAHLHKMIDFNSHLYNEVMTSHLYGQSGAPWEFNLRDILRWCCLIEGCHSRLKGKFSLLCHFVNIVYLQRLRTSQDRAAASDLFERIFGSPPSDPSCPEVAVSPIDFTVGLAHLERIIHEIPRRDKFKHLQLLSGTGSILESMMHCVRNGWLCLLVGPPKSGKTSIVRSLADLTGNTLYEYGLSGSTDTTELLGCFEQHDKLRCFREAIAAAKYSTEVICGIYLCQAVVDLTVDRRIATVKNILAAWSTLRKAHSHRLDEDSSIVIDLLKRLLEQLESAINGMNRTSDFGLGLLRKLVSALEVEEKGNVGRFEWIDGDLLRAVERGDWVLLENANLCNPTVLDRLNSLLEPGGSLMVNERGLVKGQAMVVNAHPNFRLFLTINPANGEVSRAMRNRGIEIFMMSNGGASEEELRYKDTKDLIVSFGLPGVNLIDALTKVHLEVRTLAEKAHLSAITFRELRQWLSLLQVLLDRGGTFYRSTVYSWEQCYLPCIPVELQGAARNIIQHHLSFLEPTYDMPFYVPVGWPSPVTLRDYCERSEETIIRRDCSYAAFVGSKLYVSDILSQLHEVSKFQSEGTALLKWLDSMTDSAVHLPQKLVQLIHNPEDKFTLPVDHYECSELEKMLHYATIWVLEQAPLLELDGRVQWLTLFLGKLRNRFTKVQTLLSVLRLQKQHPLVMEAKDAWSRFGQVITLDSEQLGCLNQNGIFDAESYVRERGAEAEAFWKRLLVLMFKLSCLRRSLLQWQTEDDYLQSAAEVRTPILQSYWHHMHKTTGGCDRLYLWLYPLLLSLRKLENEFLLLPQPTELSYSRLIEGHETFWKAIRDHKVDAEFVQFSWLQLRRNISELAKEADLQPAIGEVMHVGNLMDAALCVERALTKPYLWKYGGHPQLPQSMELLNLERRLLDVSGHLWGKEAGSAQSVDIFLRSDPTLWLSLFEGLTMISYMGRSGGTPDIRLAEKMTEMVFERLDSEKLKLELSFENELILMVVSPVSTVGSLCSHGCEKLKTFPRELLRSSSAQIFWFKLNSLCRHLSLLLDASLIMDLLPLIVEFTYGGDHAMLMRKIERQATAFRHALSFTLKVLSRSPVDVVAHQHIIWIMDSAASPSLGTAERIRDYAHELLFRWHSALWEKAVQEDFSRPYGACQRFQATETELFPALIEGLVQVKEYKVKLHQLKIGLDWAWFSSRQKLDDSLRSDLCQLSAILQQIICSYKSLYSQIDAIFSTLSTLHLHLLEGTIVAKTVEYVEGLLQHVQDPNIHNVICELLLPCVRLLYLTLWQQATHYEALTRLGEAWIFVGRMRMELLIHGYNVDPMAKYTYGHKQMIEKVEDIRLELKVRKESASMVKGCKIGPDIRMLVAKEEGCREDLQKLNSKLVPRPSPPQFRDFVEEAVHFMQSHGSLTRLKMFLGAFTMGSDADRSLEELTSWQDNATSFIRHLSSRFSFYRDVVQPFQLGVYELKYGLSLISGAYMGGQLFQKDMDLKRCTELVCSLMCFPSTSESANLARSLVDQRVEYIIEKAISLKSTNADARAVELELKISMLLVALLRLTHGYADSRRMTGSFFKLLVTLMGSIVTIWKQIRNLRKSREEENVKQFRLASLGEDDTEQDEASFKELFPSHWSLETLDDVSDGHELQKLVSNQDSQAAEFSLAKLVFLQEEMLKDVVSLFLRIFAAKNIVKVTDDDRIKAFLLSYNSGASIFKGHGHGLPKVVDELLFPAHLFRLALEYGNLSAKKITNINVYKDPCPSELSKILEPLAALLKRIGVLMEEWPEHPVLMQIVQFVDSVLSIPVSSPIMKALTGLELVLTKAQVWEQNAPKLYSLRDELSQLSLLVMRWRKMELESWPVLLDDVYQRHETNSKQLWFSFYDLLHSGEGLELEIILESSEELLLSSPIGEFQSRLDLLQAFYNEFEMSSQVAPSSVNSDISSVLYNMFNYYSRFLPIVQQELALGKEPFVKDLTDFVRLTKWEDYSFHSMVATSERSHRKIHKIIRKYDEFLKRPAMEICKGKRPEIQKLSEDEDIVSTNKDISQFSLEKGWSEHCAKAQTSRPRDVSGNIEKKLVNTINKLGSLLGGHIFKEDACESRQAGTVIVDALATAIITRSAELRQENKSRALKKKALVDLRRSLKELSFSHYKSDIPKDMRSSKSWFQQPATNLLGLAQSIFGRKEQHEFKSLLLENILPVWQRASNYYFDNISLLQENYRRSLDYHKDLSLAEVETFTRYMEYILYLQQKHRRKIQEFSCSLTAINKLITQLKKIGTHEMALPKQGVIRNVLWQQKSFFDRLCQLSAEVDLFFQSITGLESEAKPEVHNLLKTEFEKLRACKVLLDDLLLPELDVAEDTFYPVVITSDMYHMAKNNFQVIQEIKCLIGHLLGERCIEDGAGNNVLKTVYHLLEQGMEMSAPLNDSGVACCPPGKDLFANVTTRCEEVVSQFRLAGQNFQGNKSLQDEKAIKNYEMYFDELMAGLRIDQIYKSSMSTLNQVVNIYEQDATQVNELGMSFLDFLRSLSVLLDQIAAAGLQILSEYVCLHKAIAKLGYILLNVLNQLYQDGFCGAREENQQEKENGKFQDAEGTGMGEGEGTKDVSEQIEEEEQLLGTSENEAARPDSQEANADKGIEMHQDFAGDMFDVSEEESNEEDQNEDDDEEKLDSKMGEHDEKEEVVDEKLWDKDDEDAIDQEANEKVERESSVPNKDYDDLELRAKNEEDSKTEKDSEEDNHSGQDNEDKSNDSETAKDATEENAFEDPTGLEPSSFEAETMEEADKPSTEEQNSTEEQIDDQPSIDKMDTDMAGDSFPEDMNLDEQEEPENDESQVVEKTVDEPEETEDVADRDDNKKLDYPTADQSLETKNNSRRGEVDGSMGDANIEERAADQNAVDSATAYGVSSMSKGDPLSNNPEQPHTQEASGGDGQQEQLPPTAGPSNADNYASSTTLPIRQEESGLEKLDANPYRSLGDALKMWKQRARMVQDEQDKPADAVQETEVPEQEDRQETYKYVSNDEKASTQAMGSATDDQINLCEGLDKLLHESEDIVEEKMAVDEPRTVKDANTSSDMQLQIEDRMDYVMDKLSDEREKHRETDERQVEEAYTTNNRDGSLVSFEILNGLQQSSELQHKAESMRQELETELGTGISNVEAARKVWQKYEQLTGRLSQDLAEQLRLLLEPTLAARLQGDYKSGKRLNMKKIIPFVASEFRKDKIWLRRTKPNKRQYQVVLALDDSRSMSESHCGHMALEALITICRSMTQLEVGQMAVASFGKKGNVRVLHDFEQPFSSEAGVKIISEFSFRQDNTISDEPMVDLLQYMTRFLNVMARQYAPSGQKELQQLVLIIADGRFHEKESLRRCVRDALGRKQLLAFLVLDNPKESLLDMKSVSFSMSAPTFSQYLDTFPFPYYVLLKDIEALPRTLADLLRQWFELMQYTATT